MSANLGKEGLSASTRSLARKHAEKAAEAVIQNFQRPSQHQVRIALVFWIEAHLDVAAGPARETIAALRDAARSLARELVLNAEGGPSFHIEPKMSTDTCIEILEDRLSGALDRFIELLAAKIEKKGIRKAQREGKVAAERVARFAAEWLL